MPWLRITAYCSGVRIRRHSASVRVTGTVGEYYNQTQIAAAGVTELDAPLHCVDRHTVPSIRWGGVPLAALLDLEPPAEDAAHVLLAAARGYSSSLPLAELHHPAALLATHADGEPLTPEHGWPARVVLPHLYGFKGPKWILEITHHHDPQQGWWEERGYHARGRADLEERWAHQD